MRISLQHVCGIAAAVLFSSISSAGETSFEVDVFGTFEQEPELIVILGSVTFQFPELGLQSFEASLFVADKGESDPFVGDFTIGNADGTITADVEGIVFRANQVDLVAGNYSISGADGVFEGLTGSGVMSGLLASGPMDPAFVELIGTLMQPEQSTGACCLDDGSCQTLTADDCDSEGGAYQGDGTVCDPNPCDLCSAADVNIDGEVNADDVQIFLTAFRMGADLADFDRSGEVDSGDLFDFLELYHACEDDDFLATIQEVQMLLEQLAGNSFVQKALDHLEKAQDEFDGDLPTKKVFKEVSKALKDLLRAEGDGQVVGNEIELLWKVALASAASRIGEAVSQSGDSNEIEKAIDDLFDGDDEAGEGKFDKAVKKYGKAWEHARKAME